MAVNWTLDLVQQQRAETELIVVFHKFVQSSVELKKEFLRRRAKMDQPFYSKEEQLVCRRVLCGLTGARGHIK